MFLSDNTIRHLGHSSFMMKIDGLIMIFDYCGPGLNRVAGGKADPDTINPKALAAEQVYVFASHGHQDHFHPEIYAWASQIPGIHYIIAYDIPPAPVDVSVMKPGERKRVGRIEVQSYASSDQGLAYSIYYNGRHIYFAGDNAFWNWDGDLDDEIYHRTALADIDHQTPMDIAFQVCDPRLEGMGDGGIHVFARIFQPRLLVPMHAFGDYDFNTRAARRLRESGFAHDFWCICRVGVTYALPF
jgi:L-ascorbate metabolism protein UlaG (beta-lactamase superfamily)